MLKNLLIITDERINNAVLHENGEPLFVAPYVKEFIRAELQQDGKLSTELVDKNDEPMRDSKGMPVTLQSFIKALQTDSTFKKAFNSNPPAVGDSAASDGVERYTNNQRRIILTREQAKDVQIYREAVKRAGSVDNVIVEQQ